MDHLNNMLFYEKLGNDPTERFSEEIMSVVAGMTEREMLSRDTFDFLRPKNARTSQFYDLPKIHKKDIPGRPIVSSCGAPTKNISLFVDHHDPTQSTFVYSNYLCVLMSSINLSIFPHHVSRRQICCLCTSTK